MHERKNYGGNFNGEPIRFVLTSREYVQLLGYVVQSYDVLSKCLKAKVKPKI